MRIIRILRIERRLEKIKLRFCRKCGSYMKKIDSGFRCRKCNNFMSADLGLQETNMRRDVPSNPIYIDDGSKGESGYVKVSQTCPSCGVSEAFRWVTRVSGEHAGISSERTIERYKCVKCSHHWTRTT